MGDKFFGYLTGGAALIAGVMMMQPELILFGGATLLGTALAESPLSGLGRRGIESSATYGFDQSQNVAYDGAPAFYVLGEERIAPAYVSFFSEQDEKKQYMNALLYAGEGGEHGIESLTDFELNDQPVAAFKSVTITTRLGASGQTAMSGFDKDAESIAIGVTLDIANFPDLVVCWSYTSSRAVDELAVAISWYSGLISPNGKTATWGFRVETATPGSVSSMTTIQPDVNGDFYDKKYAKRGLWVTSGKTTAIHRIIVRIPFDTRGTYQIRITQGWGSKRTSPRLPTVVRVEEIREVKNSHAGRAMIGIKMMAQEMLDGGLPRVTCKCRGWKVKNQGDSAAAWTRNPAKLVQAVLIDSDRGCGDWVKESQLDHGSGGSWRTVATRCLADAASSGDHKEPHWELDYVLDADASAIEHLDTMLATFRASMIEWGGKIRLVQDYPGSSVATFDARQGRSAANRPILALLEGPLAGKADLKEIEIPADDPARPTHVKIQYRDRDVGYERRWTKELVSPEWSSGDPVVRREFTLLGVTRETQAMREARCMINRGRLRTLFAEYGVGLGDLDLLPGDVVTLCADYPTWSDKLFQVQASSYDIAGRGRIRVLVYDANAYDDTSDTLPARPGFVSRQEALKKARQIPRGASNVVLQEISP